MKIVNTDTPEYYKFDNGCARLNLLQYEALSAIEKNVYPNKKK